MGQDGGSSVSRRTKGQRGGRGTLLVLQRSHTQLTRRLSHQCPQHTEGPVSTRRPGGSRQPGPPSTAPLPLPSHPFESSISFPELPRVTDPHGRVLSKMPRWGEGRITRSVLSANTRGKEAPAPASAVGRGRSSSPGGMQGGGHRFAQTPREHLTEVVPAPLSRHQDGQVGACPMALPLKVKDQPAPRTLGPQGLHSGPRLPRPVSRPPHPS